MAASSGSDQIELVVWIAVALVLLLGAGAAVFAFIRRWFHRGQQVMGETGSFSLAELRQLRDEGQISAEEFDKLKHEVLGKSLS